MFLSIIITLVLGSIIGIITSISVYGFISLVKFLTNALRNPDRNFETLSAFFTNTSEFILFILLIPFAVGLIVGILREIALGDRWHGPPDVILATHSEKKPLILNQVL